MRKWVLIGLAGILLTAMEGCGPSTGGSGVDGSSPSFDLAMPSGALSVVQGQSGSATLSLVRTAGFSEPVTLSAEAVPASVSVRFSPEIVRGSESLVTVRVPVSTPDGNFVLLVRAQSASGGETATLRLTVAPRPGAGVSGVQKVVTYTQVYADGLEGTGGGLVLSHGAVPIADPALVLDGMGSVRLSGYGTISTDPATVQLPGGGTYLIEFRYRILDRGSDDGVLSLRMEPPGSSDPATRIDLPPMLKNAPTTGVFSSGAQAAGATAYSVHVMANTNADVVVDDVRVMRQDVVDADWSSASWARLISLPFPRLGNYILGTTTGIVQGGLAEGAPYLYSVQEIEARLSLSDLVVGPSLVAQGMDPASIRRIRMLNPDIAILPYRISQEQQVNLSPPRGAGIDVDYQFLEAVPEEWYARDSSGGYLPNDWPGLRHMDVSPYCPAPWGATFRSYLVDWLAGTVLASGLWDGVFLDNLFARVSPHIQNYREPTLFDDDFNRDGRRDETPAAASEMTRAAAQALLADLRERVGDGQLVIGNTGALPELPLAPYVNGYVFECANKNWDVSWLPATSEGGWRASLDAYRAMESTSRVPALALIQGCGGDLSAAAPSRAYAVPTREDVQAHRFTMGTALLGNGFYEYDLFNNVSAPYWFDEYAVAPDGTALEDVSAKGYLGLPLGDATEILGASTMVLHEDFEGSEHQLAHAPDVAWTSEAPGEVLAGGASLIIANPVHTQSRVVNVSTGPDVPPFVPGSTYLVAFDWRVLETLDGHLLAVVSADGRVFAAYVVPGVVAGDEGIARFPLTIPYAASWVLTVAMVDGGGKMAIDNLRILQGGAGPWRRDYERGLVLVNPYSRPRTLPADELAGPLHRTGIRRIRGAQAPDINTGLPVTDALTLGPFDAIILLADRVISPPALGWH